MASVLTAEEIERARDPDVAQLWCGVFDFHDGTQYLHTGEGNITIGGQLYRGICDPINGPLAIVGDIEEQQLGEASAVDIVLAGVSREFVLAALQNASLNEGRDAALSWALFKAETQEIFSRLIPVFPRARMSAIFTNWKGLRVRAIGVTLEGPLSAMNFPPGGRWNDADHQRLWPGDTALKQVGAKKTEYWQ